MEDWLYRFITGNTSSKHDRQGLRQCPQDTLRYPQDTLRYATRTLALVARTKPRRILGIFEKYTWYLRAETLKNAVQANAFLAAT